MAIPWAQLIPHAISLAETAGRILSSNKKQKEKTEIDPSLDPASLLRRIEVLEKNELKQAELIEQMAQQNISLIQKAESNYRMALAGICMGAFSIVLSVVVIFLILK